MNYEIFSVLSRPFQPHFLERELTAETIQLAVRAYQRMFLKLEEVVSTYVPSSENLSVLVGAVGKAIVAELNRSIKPGTVAIPLVPMINEQGATNWISDLDQRVRGFRDEPQSSIAMMAVAVFCYECRALWTLNPQLRDWYTITASVDLVTALQSYGFWKVVERRDVDGFDMFGTRKTIETFVTEQTKRVDQALTQQESSTLEMHNMFVDARDGTSKLLSETEDAVAKTTEIVGVIQEISAENQEKVAGILKSIETTEGQISAFAASVREELKIDNTKKLWRDRAFWSALSFWISAGVIAIAILAPPWWAMTHIETVISFLKRVGDAATQGLPAEATTAQLTAATISRLVVISAPLALYFWAVKLLVRFNNRSMMLMDDARQRHTTMDTYFHLIERSGATTEERGLMLNALFRPLPGQGQENIEPPNFMELVKKPD